MWAASCSATRSSERSPTCVSGRVCAIHEAVVGKAKSVINSITLWSPQ